MKQFQSWGFSEEGYKDKGGELSHEKKVHFLFCNLQSFASPATPIAKFGAEIKSVKKLLWTSNLRCSLPTALSFSRSEIVRKTERGGRKCQSYALKRNINFPQYVDDLAGHY